jgi:predicted dehydrogenase
MQAVRLGIIGCGIAANDLHLPAILKLRDKFTVTCVCNRTEPKAKAFAAGLGVPYVLDPAELLARDDVDAVDIALPVELNLRTTAAALAAGKHVFVEKPIALDAAQASSMVALAAAHPDLACLVAENYRYKESFRRLKALMDSGSIGRPYMAQWTCLQKIDVDNKYVQTPWRRNHRYEGGFLTDGGVHNVAALRIMFGNLTCRGAVVRSVNPALGRTDSLQFMFDSESGVAGVFTECFSAAGASEGKLLILGSEGSLSCENDSITVRRPGRPDSVEAFPGDDGYVAEFEDFYRAVREGSVPLSDFSEGRKDLESILGALEAAAR